MLVGTYVVDDDMPAQFRICPLLHAATVEPLPTDGFAAGTACRASSRS